MLVPNRVTSNIRSCLLGPYTILAKAVKTDNDNKLITISQDNPVEGDRAAGIQTTERFRRFTQRDDMFNRAFWDDDVRCPEMMEFFESYRVAPVSRRADGFTQKDFALRNAAWAVSDGVLEPG